MKLVAKSGIIVMRHALLFTFLFVTIQFVMSADFSDGLILYHTYDEGTGDVAKNVSGSGHDGKIDKPNWVDGKFKKALKFDGAGSGTFVTVESTDALNVNECTFMAWVNAEHWDATRQIVGKSVHGGCSGRGQYGLFSEAGTFKLRFEAEDGRTDLNADLPETGKWVHVAFTNDGEMATLYVDGEAVADGTVPGKLKSIGDPLRIAQDCDRPNNVFAGMIDEVRLWNRALSQDDINTLKDLSAQATPVDPLGKLSTTWGNLKSKL